MVRIHRQTALVVTLAGLTLAGGCGPAQPTSVLAGVNAIVFVKRIATDPATGNAIIGDTQVLDYRRYVPGGSLLVLEPPTPSGTLRNLTADQTQADIQGIDVSFDGTQVVFSMRTPEVDDFYHLYIARIDGQPIDGGQNARPYRQLTMANYDDVYPTWAPGDPGDRIYFVSNLPSIAGADSLGTRADEYNHSRSVSQIGSVSVLGGEADRVMCQENLSHSVLPFLRADGRIGYSRWEHLAGVNDTKLFVMNPDCTSMVALAGQHNKDFNSIVQVREFADAPNVMIGVATARERTIHAGALVTVDARGPGGTAASIDEEAARFDILTPSVPTGRGDSADGRYRNPFPLSRGRILTSWAPGFVSDRNEILNTAPDFGVYLFDVATGTRTLVYNDPGTWDLYAMPVGPRARPPAFQSTTGSDPYAPVRLSAVDVAQTSLDETIADADLAGMRLRDALFSRAVAVRVIEGFSSEVGAVRAFGITEFEGAAILGEAPVYSDGSFSALVPAKIPVHVQAIDQYGLSIRSEGLWQSGFSGEARACGGCHESRTGVVTPRSGVTTIAQQRGVATAPDGWTNLNWSVAQRATALPGQNHGELPWDSAIQPILTANCASCHGSQATVPACPTGYPNCDPFAGQTYTLRYTDPDTGLYSDYVLPVLDLSDTAILVVYDRMVATYPAAYMSLMIPGSNMRDSEIVAGTLPAAWVERGSARASRYIQKINLEGPDGSRFMAGQPLHPEELAGRTVPVTLTAEERLNLARVIDLGAQYYSRINVPGATWSMGCAYPPCP